MDKRDESAVMAATLHARVISELRQITFIIQQYFGLKSRWNGTVVIEEGVNYAGAKRYDCSIWINGEIARHPIYRWRTLIHEALHAFSPQYSRLQYDACKGWEEGVVEQLQRLLRGYILAQMGIDIPEDDLKRIEAKHPFNGYIEVLDDLQIQSGLSAEAFFLLLLKTELPKRADVVRNLGENLPGPLRAKFLTSLLLAQGRLTKRENYGPQPSD